MLFTGYLAGFASLGSREDTSHVQVGLLCFSFLFVSTGGGQTTQSVHEPSRCLSIYKYYYSRKRDFVTLRQKLPRFCYRKEVITCQEETIVSGMR
ncbi:hypothetical protein D3C76_799360 [compost metagenome]